MAERRKLGEEDLKALVANEIRASKAYDDADMAKKRQTALAYYMGEMDDVKAEVGRSSVVSRDVADTVGWMLPGIIRVFTASDRMAMCEPVEPEDEEWAEQATDAINYVFWKDNPGYKILYAATWDSCVLKNGIIKHWWDETEETEVSEHSGLSDDQLAELLDSDDVEVLTHTATETTIEQPDPMTGQPIEVPAQSHDVKIKRIKSRGRIKVECIPPEDFLLDRNATCISEARFVGHKDEVTRSDLIEMGFERNKVEKLKTAKDDDAEGLIRDDNHESEDVADDSMTRVDLVECYVRADVDGDGVAETVRCYYAGDVSGGVLLEWEVWEDDFPFSDIPCNPLPHRFEADSIADETMDVQRVKTVLMRQALDNVYASNIPTRYVEGELINPDELYNPSFGGVVMGKPGTKVTDLSVPFVANHAFDAINYQDQVIERRTGVSRTSMALDPEALQNQTATANQNAKDAAYSQIELIARNMAELGWSSVFRAILRLLIKHQDRPRTIRLRNKFIEMDPRHWNADMDITINTGLGTGSRDRDMAMLNVVLQNQMALVDRLSAGGLGDIALEMLPKIRNTLEKITESAGMKNPEQFFPEIPDEAVQALKERVAQQMAQGDPKAAADREKAQADMQIQQARMQAEMQMRQIEFDAEQAQASAKMKADALAREQEFALKREQLSAEMGLKREQLSAELNLKRELAYADLEMRRELGAMNASAQADSGGGTSSVRMGGEPG